MGSRSRTKEGKTCAGVRRCIHCCTGPVVWAYVVGTLVVWVALRACGDRWWLPTLMLFGPRWVYGLPLVVLAPLAFFVWRKLILVPAADSAASTAWPETA